MNYTMRKDAALWLKDYLIMHHETLKGTRRFDEVYLPEIQELLNDESGEVRIEAIEGCLCVLELIEAKTIEEEFIPSLVRAFNFDKNSEESMQRMAVMIGQIAYKLSKLGLLLKYKEPILNFYKATTTHESQSVQRAALFNLPCFHLLFKDVITPPTDEAFD